MTKPDINNLLVDSNLKLSIKDEMLCYDGPLTEKVSEDLYDHFVELNNFLPKHSSTYELFIVRDFFAGCVLNTICIRDHYKGIMIYGQVLEENNKVLVRYEFKDLIIYITLKKEFDYYKITMLSFTEDVEL